MLADDIRRAAYSKAEPNRRLQAMIGRSRGSSVSVVAAPPLAF
jgi:hypothetical protein